MFKEVGNAVTKSIIAMFIGLLICVPLALWKLIEIVMWVYSNISIGIKQ